MISLRLGLVLSYIIVAVVAIAVAAPLVWFTVERVYVDSQRANLLAQAKRVAGALATMPQIALSAPPAVSFSQAANAQPGIHIRMLDQNGTALIDLQPPPPGIEPLPPATELHRAFIAPQDILDRPEVTQALAGTAATAERRLAELGDRRILYAAAPVFGADNRVARVVYIATPLPFTLWEALASGGLWQISGAIGLAILLASGVGVALALAIARPMQRVVDAAGAVASGDLRQTVAEQSPVRELTILASGFNRMTQSLRQSDAAKTAFIADVSHELRTPLTVIKGAVETLQDSAADDPQARITFLDAIANETDRLINLVNDLLVLTRANAGMLQLQPQPLDIAELARTRVQRFAPLAGRKNLRVCVCADVATGYCVQADVYRVTQILDNLLGNAIRYSGQGNDVRVVLARESGEVRCAVQDTGPGIAAEHLPHIFDRFYRAEPSRNRVSGGSGLGLAITRSLVLAHGGHIHAESVEGKGTTITFWLPASS